MRDIPSERESEGTGVPLLSGKGNTTGDCELFSYILNYEDIQCFFTGCHFTVICLLWCIYFFGSLWLMCPLVSVTDYLALSVSNLTVLSSKCFSFIIVCCSLVFSPPPKAVHKSIWISYSKHTTFWNNLDDCVKFYFELLLKHFGLIWRFDQSQDTKCVYMHLKSLISVGLKQ